VQTDPGPGSEAFPSGFFDRADPSPDSSFYSWPRLVTHIDDGAIAAVGDLYEELGIGGDVLDLMASWVSHLHRPARRLTVLGMNAEELRANPQADEVVVHDLNADPGLPVPAESFDAALCCVSVDYLTRPVEVFADVARVVRPGAPFVCSFSNRCFPTKAIRGWLQTGDRGHCAIVARYFVLAGGWEEPTVQRRTPPDHVGDPLFAVWARRAPGSPGVAAPGNPGAGGGHLGRTTVGPGGEGGPGPRGNSTGE
jgi:SAM-dependent methyltransferase